MDKIEAMKVFSKVAEKGSFTAAADSLNLSKTKVTRYIYELENWLNCRLFQRTTRKISLTLAGEENLVRIREIIGLSETLYHSTQESQKSAMGSLRIATNSVFGESYLTKIITQFSLTYPNVNIELTISDSSQNMVEDRIDLAFRTTDRPSDGLIARPIKQLKSGLFATPDYIQKHGSPAYPEELKKHKVLLCTTLKPTDHWCLKKLTEKRVVQISSSFNVNNILMLKQMTLEGGGIARLPLPIAEPLIKEGKLCHVLPDWEGIKLNVWVVYLSRDHQPAIVRNFIDFALSYCQEN